MDEIQQVSWLIHGENEEESNYFLTRNSAVSRRSEHVFVLFQILFDPSNSEEVAYPSGNIVSQISFVSN